MSGCKACIWNTITRRRCRRSCRWCSNTGTRYESRDRLSIPRAVVSGATPYLAARRSASYCAFMRAIRAASRPTHSRCMFPARSLPRRDAKRTGDARLAVQTALAASTLVMACSGSLLSCGSLTPVQRETGTTKDRGIQRPNVPPACPLEPPSATVSPPPELEVGASHRP